MEGSGMIRYHEPLYTSVEEDTWPPFECRIIQHEGGKWGTILARHVYFVGLIDACCRGVD